MVISQNIYWLGGSPCSGKSSIADRLAQGYGWQVYHCDEAFDRHVQRADPARHPWLAKVPNIVWDTFWMRPLHEQVRHVVEVYTEEFPLILEDLRALSPNRPIVAEGTALLPPLVASVLTNSHQAIWLVPTPEFQRFQYPRRGAWVQGILDQCSQPDQAFSNWMDRDIETGAIVRREAEARGLKVIMVDRSRSIEANTQLVQAHFLGDRAV